MANYIASARTNYFRVRDMKAFGDWAANRPSLDIHTGENGTVCILCNDDDGAGWPMGYYDEEADGYVEFDLHQEVASHLQPGEVAIFMEAGAEKLRYVCGYAFAVRSDGEVLRIALSDIYDLVKKEWGILPSPAEY